MFLLLLAIIGFAALMTFVPQTTNSLTIDLLAQVFSISDAGRVGELRKGFPFGVLRSILLFGILFAMVNLYHHSLSITRHYRYLGEMENEIRGALDIDDAQVAFTRESRYYWQQRGGMFSAVKWVYILMLGMLLVPFLIGMIIDDYQVGRYVMMGVEVLVSAVILTFYGAYAWSSVRSDVAGRRAT